MLKSQNLHFLNAQKWFQLRSDFKPWNFHTFLSQILDFYQILPFFSRLLSRGSQWTIWTPWIPQIQKVGTPEEVEWQNPVVEKDFRWISWIPSIPNPRDFQWTSGIHWIIPRLKGFPWISWIPWSQLSGNHQNPKDSPWISGIWSLFKKKISRVWVILWPLAFGRFY